MPRLSPLRRNTHILEGELERAEKKGAPADAEAGARSHPAGALNSE